MKISRFKNSPKNFPVFKTIYLQKEVRKMKLLFENWRKFLLKEAAKSVKDLANLDYGDTSKGPPNWMLNLIQSKGVRKAAELYKVPQT
jgi:hypothetical protein